MNQFLLGDCFDHMRAIPDGSIDMVLADLPYGTTQNKWDSVLPLDQLWAHYWRVCKPDAAIVLTATQPFTSSLVSSQTDAFRYDWVWVKPHTGQLNAKRKPLLTKEDVLVFCRESPPYFPQFGQGDPYTVKRRGYVGNESYGAQTDHDTVSDGRRYPKQLLHFQEKSKIHPTQKPVALFEYLIRTYTNPGDLVLDNTAGSGTTAIAAINTDRRYICIEKDPDYHAKATARIAAHLQASAHQQAAE